MAIGHGFVQVLEAELADITKTILILAEIFEYV